MKQSYQVPVVRGTLLTDSIEPYSRKYIPEHRTVTVEGLQARVVRFVFNKVNPEETGLIAFMGLPGIGKSSKMHYIQEAAQEGLGFRKSEEFLTYHHPDGTILEVGGYVDTKSRAIITTLHADHFFGALGSDRRNEMLKDIATCRRLWGNPHAVLRFLRDLYAGEKTDIKIYTGTPEEKIQKQPGGIIDVRAHTVANSKKIILAEGVNVGQWADTIKRRTSIKTQKILYNTSFEDSLIRILRRDHDNKHYTFQEIMNARLLEYYFILELYILPALQNPRTIMLNKPREVPPFSEKERQEILLAIRNARDVYLGSTKNFTKEQQDFIDTLSTQVMERFSEMNTVNPLVVMQWKHAKIIKKEVERQNREVERQNRINSSL